jgi:hypothetical protein
MAPGPSDQWSDGKWPFREAGMPTKRGRPLGGIVGDVSLLLAPGGGRESRERIEGDTVGLVFQCHSHVGRQQYCNKRMRRTAARKLLELPELGQRSIGTQGYHQRLRWHSVELVAMYRTLVLAMWTSPHGNCWNCRNLDCTAQEYIATRTIKPLHLAPRRARSNVLYVRTSEVDLTARALLEPPFRCTKAQHNQGNVSIVCTCRAR